MSRDFRWELRGDKCWDLSTETIFRERGEPLEDCILQNREELIRLCEFIEAARVRSYLEIGVWTGKLLTTLHRLFDFELVAACDHGWAEHHGFTIELPPPTHFWRGDSATVDFRRWRAALGHVDLVLIDANHHYPAVRADFETNRSFPHRFLALHDICGARRATRGVARLWRELDTGQRLELIEPHHELGLTESLMGIGLWSATEDPQALLCLGATCATPRHSEKDGSPG